MATKKYLSLDRLTEYDALIKQEIADSISGKADSSHSHDDKYYTESEIDSKISAINTNITNITNGSTPVKEAEHADTADEATHATSADTATSATTANSATSATKATQDGNGKVISSTYETKSDASAKLTEAKTYTDTAVSGKADKTHNHDDKYDAKNSASSALDSAKLYTDEKVANLLNNSTEAVDSIMELAEAMENNADAIEALETVAASKVPTTRKINGKALSADITLSASDVGADASGSAGAVQTNLDTHIADTTKHITSTERTNWNAAKSHADSAHAPSNAQVNVIESIKVNGTAQTITSKAVNITVPTTAAEVGAAESSHIHAIYEITDLQTTLNNASSAIGANTSSITALTDRTAALEAKVGDGFTEITSAEIQALFN